MRPLIILTILLTPTICWGQRTEGCTKPLNEKYSYKTFVSPDFRSIDPEEFNNTCIKSSYISHDVSMDRTGDIEVDVFPQGMTGVEFVKCILNNVKIPSGNTVSADSDNQRIQMKNDMAVWVVDNTGKAIRPHDETWFDRLGVSKDPRDIPREKATIPRLRQKEREINQATGDGR
jgi:hypothetical protein